MDTQIIPASEAEGHRAPVHPEGRRVTSHESPVTSSNLFRFTLLSKNASANHLESHSCKNKGLKVPCFHTLTKKGVGEGVRISCFDFRVSSPNFRLSTVDCRLFSSKSFRITYIHKNALANPYGSHTSKTKDLKPFRITYLQKTAGWQGGKGPGLRVSVFAFRVPTFDCQLSTLDCINCVRFQETP
jgi:hypothetical protein